MNDIAKCIRPVFRLNRNDRNISLKNMERKKYMLEREMIQRTLRGKKISRTTSTAKKRIPR